MKRTTIAIDIDDVIAGGTQYLIELTNQKHGSGLTFNDYNAVGGSFWGYYERVWQAHGLEKALYSDYADEMARDQSRVPLLPDAEFAISELNKKFDIVFITARPTEWESATRQWFRQHLLAENIELYFAGNHYDDKAQSKGELASKLGASLLIDDNVGNCQSALDQGLDVILFGNYGWQGEVVTGMPRCEDWPAVLGYFDEAKR